MSYLIFSHEKSNFTLFLGGGVVLIKEFLLKKITSKAFKYDGKHDNRITMKVRFS